jgi:hypothetical protein
MDFAAQARDLPILLSQGLGLEDRLPLGLREIVTTELRYLMQRAGRAWLDSITLAVAASAGHRGATTMMGEGVGV